MRMRTAKLVVVGIALWMPIYSADAIDNIQARAFAGRDVQINAENLTSFHGTGGEDVLVIEQYLRG